MSEKIYLVCMEDGTVIDVITAESFEEAYGNTVEQNHGHCVIELSDEVLRKVMEKLVARGWYKKEALKEKWQKKYPETGIVRLKGKKEV